VIVKATTRSETGELPSTEGSRQWAGSMKNWSMPG
jgi:hypothetical protein